LCYPIKRIDSYPHALGEYNKMAQTLLEMTKDLTRTLVETGMLSAEDVPDALQKTHATLTALKAQEEIGTTSTVPGAQTAPVDWRKSITKHAVTCLDCGQTFKQLTIRHLRQHGLDARSYRAKYAIPRTQPLAARATTARRREVVQETRPWEKSPRYRKGQPRHGTASPEPEAETLPEETEEPSTAAPAQPKRQRKTTPKKQTARKTRAAG
jgi:predicted transcriptional regulator